ncbi:MAG: hypothetical protein ACPGPC_11365 [Alphaproteobacteria bacterium]
MLMRFSKLPLFAVMIFGLSIVLTSVASAIPLTRTFNFTATNFIGAGFPVPTVIGSVTVDWDNSSDVTDGTTVTINSLNITAAPTIRFTYFTSNDRLVIGANSSASTFADFTDDFRMIILDASTQGTTLGSFVYATAATESATALDRTLEIAAYVPEPGPLATFALAVVGIGLTRRRS